MTILYIVGENIFCRYCLQAFSKEEILKRHIKVWFKSNGKQRIIYTSNSSKGCVLQVDLECPKELHELHDDYPLTPDKIEIKREMLSEYTIVLLEMLKN